jgi:glycosyltransferase involved in cell wall biosynthesis
VRKVATEQRDAFRFGHDDLGPVVADYLARLHALIMEFEEERGARTLFVSRAGIRIRRALDAFVRAGGLPAPANAEFFWISRLMVAKGVWNRDREAAIDIFSKEFQHASLTDFVRAMFRFSPRGSKIRPVDRELEARGETLGQFLQGSNQFAQLLRGFFEQQSLLFGAYVKNTMRDAPAALLIDTGWQGRTQALLTRAFPEVDWWGGYFGRSGFADSDRAHWPQMIGLAFESDRFDPARPETCIVLNRHLIENLFEPRGHSIEWLAEPQPGVVIAPDADAILADAPTRETDPIFAGVMAYLETLDHANRPAELRRRAREAWARIAEMTVHPTRADVDLFVNVKRSADFGREAKVSMVLPPEPRFEGDTAERRVAESLWPCGQAAAEYEPQIAKPLQKRLAGVTGESKPTLQPAQPVARAQPRVAIITRTMDRPMFLKRALDSVARQTFRDYVQVVVNDGGDNDAVMDVIRQANCDHARIRLVDAVANRGMEAASNLAIRNSASDYVIIHDDDDTWEPAFLEKTVAFMDGKAGSHYGGVVTRSTYVSEEVTASGVVIHGRDPYNGWIENVHLVEMAIGNFFPPIAFLFKRDLWEKLGGYNEDYPVLGDWDFNLRFLIEADIAVIPEALANYHHRDRGDVTTFGNSVIAGRNKHLEYAAVVRNNFVRSLVRRGDAAAATLAGLGMFLADQRATVRASHQKIAQIGQDTQAFQARLRSMGSSAWSDAYWLALQKVLKALGENDAAKLDELAAMASGNAGAAFNVMSLVRGGKARQAPMPTTPANVQRAAAHLLKEIAEHGQAPFRDVAVPPDFDEGEYLRQNPDVDARVKDGTFSSGFEHYVRYGRGEGRLRPTK